MFTAIFVLMAIVSVYRFTDEKTNPNYIVVFKYGLNSLDIDNHVEIYSKNQDVFNIQGAFQEGVRGYLAKNVNFKLLEKIKSSPIVDFVEEDQIVKTRDLEKNAPWGLARVSHRQHPEESEKHLYSFKSNSGQGVVVYIVDTGVNIHHEEFQGRAVWGKTIPQNDVDQDGNGHGTHVAGTVAGKTFGVAKKAQIVAVKVLGSNGSGTMSDVVRGIEYVAQAHNERVESERSLAKKENRKPKRVLSAANMSLGGGKSRALDMAVNAVVDAGVHFAVAAGNDNKDACGYSPASANKAITVGATTIKDSRAWFSNWGKCVDIFAPGHEIKSAWIGGNKETNIISGTSMASPHIAGVIASFLSRKSWRDLTTLEFKKRLIKKGTENVIDMGFIPQDGSKDTPNVLVFTLPPHHNNDEF
jgi:cerevisin